MGYANGYAYEYAYEYANGIGGMPMHQCRPGPGACEYWVATTNPAHYEEALAASVGPELWVGLDVTRVQRLLLLAVRSADAALG